MDFKIIVDSCCDLPGCYKDNKHFRIAPLTIDIDDFKIIDDNTFNQKLLIEKMKTSHNSPKTSCPSPESYMQAYDCDEKDVYCITLSSKLSGSYNSGVLGKNLYIEEKGEKNIYVLDSCSASAGETVLALKIFELAQSGMPFDKVVEIINKFKSEMTTMFVLESLENLRKNGRLSNIQATLANVLNIKPIMAGTKDGEIEKVEQLRGIKKALSRMVDIVANSGKNLEQKLLCIAHCNCYQRALDLKAEFERKCNFKDILIVDTAGISSVYANDGGIVIAY